MLMLRHSPENRQLFHATYDYVAGAGRMELSPEFLLRDGPANVEVTGHAEVDNSWLEAAVTLQEVVTGAEYEGAAEMAYYWGRDSDGSWTEGSQTARLVFGQVPDGQYRLVTEAAADPSIPSMPYSITVRQDVSDLSIFSLGSFLLLLVPAGVALWKMTFEKQRWMQSDYGEE